METETLLKEFSAQEKTAYLQAIASLATADRSASQEEIEYLTVLCNEAALSSQEQTKVLQTAKENNDNSLPQSLQVLKNSELRFSLIADLIQFAESDQNYSEEEKKNVEKIAAYLQIDPQQYTALNQFVTETKRQNVSPEQMTQNNFLSGSGLQQKLQGAGINIGSLAKGLLGTVGPMLLAKVMGSRSGGSGIPGMGSGGLGSLISGLGGGNSRSTSPKGGGGLTDLLSKFL